MKNSTLQTRLLNLLKQYQGGEHDVLIEMIELERSRLFDYLFRMCGQRDSIVQIIDETAVALRADRSLALNSLDQFYHAVYATARSFCSHMWNADTSALENPGFESMTQGPHIGLIKQIEKSIAQYPAWEREPILLHIRNDFSMALIALITSTPEATVQNGYNSGLVKIAQIANQTDPTKLRQIVAAIPPYTYTVESSNATMALSQLMEDIDKVKTSVFTLRNGILVTGVIMIVVYIIYLYQTYANP